LGRFDVGGKSAVITGAAGGLGRAFALSLGAAGARVSCIDRDAEGLAETARLGAALGISVPTAAADLAVATEVEAALEKLVPASAVDILINNAGIATLPGRTHEIAVPDWDRAMAANLRSMFLVTRAVLPGMVHRQCGSIINLSSFLGLVGAYPQFPITAIPYATTKAGVVGFTRQLAIEYATDGIRANAIAPGWHGGTNLGRERRATATPEEGRRFEDYITASVPMGRRGTPEDLCGLVQYLASDASQYLTGQVIAHDGGITAA
jgi:NAD(P)-dependent dehydrogenase (short-subunit alcohol dehydrogenase family)